jgi:raffinose/stachyose/melibiose transport system substrate-binding protein
VNSGRSFNQLLRARGMTRRGVLRGGAVLGFGAALGREAGVRSAVAQESGEPVNLTIWLEGEPGTVTAFSEIIDQYMAENPNVAVELTYFGSDLFNPTLVPALNAGEGPDIWAFGTGPGQPQAIIEAGHALDLTPYFCELGWNEKIPEQIVNYTSSDGKLWAVGDSVESTQLFYNTAIFEENGIEVPATWE